jgi:hypothetical protein
VRSPEEREGAVRKERRRFLRRRLTCLRIHPGNPCLQNLRLD